MCLFTLSVYHGQGLLPLLFDAARDGQDESILQQEPGRIREGLLTNKPKPQQNHR